MSVIVVSGDKMLERFANGISSLSTSDGNKALARATNRAGDIARTQVIREVAKSSGLKTRTVRNAIKYAPKTKRATYRNLSYTLSADGGNIRLKYFPKHETRDGVVANLGQTRGKHLFEGTFFRGGAFPRRRRVDITAFGGHVLRRMSDERYHLEHVRSGVYIPDEMLQDASSKAFEDTIAKRLPERIRHELSLLLP